MDAKKAVEEARRNFIARKSLKGETRQQYARVLTTLAADCEFGHLEDRIVNDKVSREFPDGPTESMPMTSTQGDEAGQAPPPVSPLPVSKTSASRTPLSRYKKTGGAADGAGNDYRHKMLTLVFLRMLAAGYEFQLASNMQAAGWFDDIVMRYRKLSDDDWNSIFVQLKHKPNKKKCIPMLELLGLSGDLSLVKYCHSYETMKWSKELHSFGIFNNHKINIFTNASIADSLVCEVESDPLLDTGGKAVSFKAGDEVFQGLCEWVDIKEALTELHGQVEGKSGEGANSKIMVALNSMNFISKSVTSLRDELLNNPTLAKLKALLSKLEPVKDKGTYSSFLTKLQVYTNQVHESELDSKIKEQFSKVWECSVDLEAGAMLHALKDKVKSWWQKDHFYLTQDSPLWLDVIKSQTKTLSKTTIERLTEFHVEFEERSLQILDDRINDMFNDVGGILNVCVDSRTAASSLRVHQALAKFRPNEIVLHVNVKTLLEREEDVLSAWTSRWCRLLVVECDTQLDQSQAARIGEKILKIVAMKNDNKLLVLIAPEIHELHLSLYESGNCMRFNDNCVWNDLTDQAKKNILSHNIVINGTQSTLTLSSLVQVDYRLLYKFDLEVISEFLQRDVSCGKDLDGECKFFVTRRLKGISDDCGPFSVNAFNDVGDKVALLVAKPGMGKSTLFKHFANSARKDDPLALVVHLKMNDCVEYLKYIKVDQFEEYEAKKFLIKAAIKTTNSVEKLLFWALEQKLVVFVDGVDEVCPHYEQQVFKLLSFLKDMKFSRLWVASRPVLQTKLETMLQVKSLNLVDFSEADRKEFFDEVWMANVPSMTPEKCSEATESLLTLLNDSLGKDNPILGVPLMAAMIAEIFQERLFSANGNVIELKENERIDVMNLYSMFIKKKFDLYCVEKKKTQNRELAANIADEETLLKRLHRRHRLAALRVLFSREEIAGLQFKGKYRFHQDLARYLKEVSDGRDELGIIDNVVDGIPHFVDRSFAEYFAATWLALHFKDNKAFIERIIFDPAYKLLTEMFHRSLAKNHPLHVAVLNRDLEATERILNVNPNNTDVNELDAGGRTPLHLAVLLIGTDRHPDFVPIVEYLTQKRNTRIDVADQVLGWTPLRYAEWSRSWKALDILLEKLGNVGIKTIFRYFLKKEGWPKPDPAVMLDAARDASVLVVRYLAEERGGKLDCRGTEGESMIHRAAEGDNVDMLKYLHKKITWSFLPLGGGLSLDTDNSRGLTAFQEAAQHGAYNAMAVLLELKASFRGNSRFKASQVQLDASLLCAAYTGSLQSVENFVKLGASVDHQDNKGHTAAWVAMHRQHYGIMDWLLLSGSKDGDTPLHVACANGEVKIVTFILSRGDDIEALGGHGRTPLMFAAIANKSWAVVNMLLEKGANVDGSDKDGKTPLMFAASNSSWPVVNLLLEKGAKVDSTDKDGKTPLMFAAIANSSWAFVNLLLEKGATVECRDKDGKTPLMFAASNSSYAVVNLLLEKGAKVDSSDKDGKTPLMIAASNKSWAVVNLLLEKGAKVDSSDKDGKTPLMFAASNSSWAVVNLLLEKGAKVDCSDKDGNTPLMFASAKGSERAVKLLLPHGAEPNVKNKKGETPLDVARLENNDEVLKYLSSKSPGGSDFKSQAGSSSSRRGSSSREFEHGPAGEPMLTSPLQDSTGTSRSHEELKQKDCRSEKVDLETLSARMVKELDGYGIDFKDYHLQQLADATPSAGVFSLLVKYRTTVSMIKARKMLAKFRGAERKVVFLDLPALQDEATRESWLQADCWDVSVVECSNTCHQLDIPRLCDDIFKLIQNVGKSKLILLVGRKDHQLIARLHNIGYSMSFTDYCYWCHLSENARDTLSSAEISLQKEGIISIEKIGSNILQMIDEEVMSQIAMGETRCGKPLDKLNITGKLIDRRLKTEDGREVNSWSLLSDEAGRVVLLVAEPGMGKTTLFKHLASLRRILEIPKGGGVFLVRAKTSTAVTAAMIMQALSNADSLPLSEEEKARCWAKSCGKYSHLFVDLQTMHNCQKELLFTWEHTDIHTLVVECDTELCVEEERSLIEELARVSTKLKKNAKKLLVLLLPDGRLLNGQADLGCPREYPDNFKGSLLDEKSLQNLANMEVNLQGVSIKLSDLFAGGDQTFLKQINSCALSQLLKNDIRCGKDLAKEDGVFVERRLKNGTPNEIPFVAKSVLDVEEKMVLMVADPGMGKSTLIKHLAIQAKDKDPSAWVVVIRLNDWAHLFDNGTVHASNFLVQCELTEGNELERQVFDFGKTKLIVFVDGVDEMFPKYLNKVATLLAEMKDLEKVERLWITSRPVCQEALESALGVTAHALQGLSGKEQQLLHKETCKSVEKLQLVAFANRFQYLETLLGVNELDIVLKSPLLAMRAFAKDNPPNNAPAFFKECIQDIFEIYCRDKLKISHVSLPAIVDVKNNLKTDFVQIHGQVAASNTDLNHDFQAIRQEILAYKTQDFNRRVEERHDVTGMQRHARGEHDSRFFCPQMAPHLVTMLREQQHSANYPTLVPTQRISLLKWGIIVCLLLWYVVKYPFSD